jgi:signal transduction histidine kinase
MTSGIARRPVPADLPLPGDAAQALLVAPVLVQQTLRGRAVIARENGRKFTRDDLEFLLVLVGQAAAGFEAGRLQAKAEEVAVLEERARIARDLHDGFIQSLAGIDLRVEACKLHLQRDPSRVPPALEELHQAVDRGYREVRHYLTVLRTASRQPDDFGSTLDRLAAEFAIRERLRVYLSRPPSDPGLPTSTAYELTQIVREALHNAVRHGGATQAVVKLAKRPSHVYLVVRDNGRGFRNGDGSIDADGFLSTAAAPWSIRERAASLGGSLRVWTRADEGAEISLMIPVSGGARVSDHGGHACRDSAASNAS